MNMRHVSSETDDATGMRWRRVRDLFAAASRTARMWITWRRRESVRGRDRVLATVVFTDIVSSTERVAELGDREWRRLLDRHDAVTRRELECHQGAEIGRTGDGFLATFDSPARAVKCVAATMESLRPHGLRLRVGVHAGEVELRNDGIDGIAVHIGSRVCARAEPDEILVSQTVKDATTGSDLRFTDRGQHVLKVCPTAGSSTPRKPETTPRRWDYARSGNRGGSFSHSADCAMLRTWSQYHNAHGAASTDGNAAGCRGLRECDAARAAPR
jgi:class 3 adenylate cyclase